MYAAILFDMDGTLVASDAAVARSWRAARAHDTGRATTGRVMTSSPGPGEGSATNPVRA